MLRESLESEAIGGATLRELEAEIDKRRRLLTNEEREAAWLYAGALVKRPGFEISDGAWVRPFGWL